MGRQSRMLCLSICFLIVVSSNLIAETYHLSDSQDWQTVSESDNLPYLLAVSELKKAVACGDVDQAQELICKLTAEYPELAGQDLQDFMEAEYALAVGDWTQAADLYKSFVAKYPESWLYEAALEREYDIASAFLSGQKRKALKVLRLNAYEDGEIIMRRVAEKTGNSNLAYRALERLAVSFEERDMYADAYQVWAEISSRWPTGGYGKDSLLGMARSLHSGYKGPRYQSVGLKSAQGYYEKYETIYPEDAKELELEQVKGNIKEQIAFKNYAVAKYYHRTGSYLAANSYYQYVLDNWPDSNAAKLASHQMDIVKVQIEREQRCPEKEKKGLLRFLDLFDFNYYKKDN